MALLSSMSRKSEFTPLPISQDATPSQLESQETVSTAWLRMRARLTAAGELLGFRPVDDPAWRQYEALIHRRLKELAGDDAEVVFDGRLMGRYSNTWRQVDVVVNGTFPGVPPSLSGHHGLVTMAVDCKFWTRPVSLADADRFAGFVEDLGVPLALLVTTKPATDAAMQRISGIRGAYVDVVGPEDIPHAFTAYCVRCRTTVPLAALEEITMKNGRPAVKGRCAECGTSLFKIGRAV